MQVSSRGWLLVGVFGVFAFAVIIFSEPNVTAQTAANTESARQWTHDSLGKALSDLGLRPTVDRQRYDFSFKATYQDQEWELTMSAVLSQNGKSLWLISWLDELPKNSADVPKTALLRLLANNDRLGKGKFFAYIPGNRRVVLQRVIDNQNMTTATLRDALSDLGGSVVETYPYWAVTNWTKAQETAADQPPRELRDASRDTQFSPISRN